MEATYKQDYIRAFVDELVRSVQGQKERTDSIEPTGNGDYLDELMEVFS